MAMRNVAKFSYNVSRVMFRALNWDLKRPSINRIIGGIGPFDFSGAAAPAAVPLTIKFDAESEVTVNVNLTVGVADINAVTVDELVARVNAAAPVDMTASKEGTTLYFKLAYSGTDDPTFIQVYGELAELCGIGQGLAQKFIKTDVIKTFNESPTLKEDETVTTQPADGAEVSVIIEGYKKGVKIAVTFADEDFELMELIEGGTINAITGAYDYPHENTDKKYFEIFVFNPVYGEGENKEDDIVAWDQVEYKTCTGSMGERNKGRNFLDSVFNIIGTNYTNESGVRSGAATITRLTKTQWAALDFDNL